MNDLHTRSKKPLEQVSQESTKNRLGIPKPVRCSDHHLRQVELNQSTRKGSETSWQMTNFSHPEGRDAEGFSVFVPTERFEILDHEAAAHTVLNRDWVAFFMDLLTPDHPQSNTLMRDLNVEIRNKNSPTWRSIATWKISRLSYNQLRGPWKELNEFRITKETQ